MALLSGHDGYTKLPALEDGVSDPYSIPVSREAVLDYRGIPYDLVEDLLPNSAAWKQVAPMFLPRDETAVGPPITPLHGGHVGLLCTAGLLNGIFGNGDERHIARWRSVKYVTEFHEQEEDTRITRRREKWSTSFGYRRGSLSSMRFQGLLLRREASSPEFSVVRGERDRAARGACRSRRPC